MFGGGGGGLSQLNFWRVQWARLRWAHFLFLAYALFHDHDEPT